MRLPWLAILPVGAVVTPDTGRLTRRRAGVDEIGGCWRSVCGWKCGCPARTRRRRVFDSRNLSSPSVTAGQPLRLKLPGSCTREDGLDRTRPSPGSAAVGFGEGVWAGPGRGHGAGEGPGVVATARAPGCQASRASGSHTGSHRDEQLSGISDLHEQRAGTPPRSRTDLNGLDHPYGYLRI